MKFQLIILLIFIPLQCMNTLRQLCVHTVAHTLDDSKINNIMDELPENCLHDVLVEKLRKKLFPLTIDKPHDTITETRCIARIAINENGTKAMYSLVGGDIKLCDLSTKKISSLYHPPKTILEPYYPVAMTPDGTKGIFCSSSKFIKVWDLCANNEIGNLMCDNSYMESLAITADGKRALSSSKKAKLLDLQTYTEVATISSNGRAVAITPDGTKGIIGGDDGVITILYLNPYNIITLAKNRGMLLKDVAISADGKKGLCGYSCYNSGALMLLDLIKHEEIFTLRYDRPIYTIAITSDGTIGLCGFHNRLVRIINLTDKSEIATLLGHTHFVDSVAISEDGTRALSSCGPNLEYRPYEDINSWDLRTLLIDRFPLELLKKVWHAFIKDNKSKKECYQLICDEFQKEKK